MPKTKTPNGKPKSKPREKPLSLYPMNPDDVLRILLNTPPMPKKPKNKKKVKEK